MLLKVYEHFSSLFRSRLSTYTRKMSIRSKKDLEEDAQRLREWVQKTPHLPRNFDDELLLAFVGGTKTIEIAKQKLDNFCSLRTKYPQYLTFPVRDPLDPGFKEYCERQKMFFLPKTTPEGYRVMVTLAEDVSKFDNVRFVARMTALLETAIAMFPNSNGFIFTFDSEKAGNASFVAKLSIPALFFLVVHYLQGAFPMKLKKLISYNAPPLIEGFINTFFKPLIKKKLLERLILTSSGPEVLKDHFPLELLPSDMPGGKGPTSDELEAEWVKIVEDRRDWLRKTSELCTDEEKRPSDGSNSYGIDGTFRKLNVD